MSARERKKYGQYKLTIKNEILREKMKYDGGNENWCVYEREFTRANLI